MSYRVPIGPYHIALDEPYTLQDKYMLTYVRKQYQTCRQTERHIIRKEMEERNPASDLVRKRWDRTSAKKRQDIAKFLNAARNRKLTPKRRKEIARKAAAVRWGKKLEAEDKPQPKHQDR